MRTRYKDLSLQQIRTFREVCRSGSYTTVAKQIQLSTSAVWEQMRGLERYFEVSLLEKFEGSVRPTADGHLLLSLVAPLLSGLESTRETLHQMRGRLPGKLTIVSGMRMLAEEVALGVVEFQKEYPSVRVQTLYVEDHKIDQFVERGETDLAIALERGPEESESMAVRHETAYDFDYVLIGPRKNALFNRKSLKLTDILRHSLVVGARGTRSRAHIDAVFHRHGLADQLEINMETNSTATTIAAVRAGAGLGIVAAPIKGTLSKGLSVRSLNRWFGQARYVFIWKKGAILTPTQEFLAKQIRNQANSSV